MGVFWRPPSTFGEGAGGGEKQQNTPSLPSPSNNGEGIHSTDAQIEPKSDGQGLRIMRMAWPVASLSKAALSPSNVTVSPIRASTGSCPAR